MAKIEGKKVILRNWKESDKKDIVKMLNDKMITKFTSVPKPYKLKDANEFMKRATDERKKVKAFHFAIVSKENKKLLGNIDIMEISKKSNKAEIGYLLGKEHRGKGFMAEAIKLALGYGFGKLRLNRIRISCSTKNKASKHVIERTGAKFEGIERESTISGDGKTHDLRLYSVLRREFKGKKFF